MRIATFVVLAILLNGCGFVQIATPVANWHEYADFTADPNFTGQPENYHPIMKTTPQIAENLKVVHLEMFSDQTSSIFGTKSSSHEIASGILIKYGGKPFVLSAGHIALNNQARRIHKIFAYFPDCQTPPEEMEVIIIDKLFDFSLLRFKNESFEPPCDYAVLGFSSKLKRGEKVIALGSPLGIEHSISEGVVMNLDVGRQKKFRQPQLIFHSALANPGNSGGPLVNENGEVVAIVIGGIINAPNAMSYAVPIDDIRNRLRNLKKCGAVPYPELKIHLWDSWLWNEWDFKTHNFSKPDRTGIMITDSQIENLKTGDIILECDARKFENQQEIWKYLLIEKTPGDKIDFKIYRYGKELTTSIILQSP